MTTRILLGVDTEADDQWSATGRQALAVRNVHELPRLQELCDRYRVLPTYLVTFEMAAAERARSQLQELAQSGRCEIGSHHHPWSTPPLVDGHVYPLNLSRDRYREQLGRLTEAVAKISGEAPVSYRAGRNGFAGWHVEILEENGYLVDSSVDPFFNEKRKGGPSFAGAPITPYFVGYDDPRRVGDSRLLEIPVTSALDRRWPRWLETAYADVSHAYHFRRSLRLLGIVRPIWLRPSYSKRKDMLSLARRLLEGHAPTANILFHSSELLVGGSPYNQTREDLERFYRDLEALLAFLTEGGALGATFRQFRESWCEATRN
ncbi:MAG TPA: polysaccharide deacetylase family protein [Vicinamibacteria bacterium]|nr:polysaccharide deacetylase family protein [Vicinamibacteria bacterium]